VFNVPAAHDESLKTIVNGILEVKLINIFIPLLFYLHFVMLFSRSPGSLQVMKNLESHTIQIFIFPAWQGMGFYVRSWKVIEFAKAKEKKCLTLFSLYQCGLIFIFVSSLFHFVCLLCVFALFQLVAMPG
jgi:hypothetical protein